MMKTCSRCGIKRDSKYFNLKNKVLGIQEAASKGCTRKSNRDHYRRNHQYYLKKVAKRNKLVRKLNKQYIHEFLISHPCTDCGESDPVVLEFDHFENKRNSVAIMSRTSTLKSLIIEINKCVVRCANCHRRKTAKQFHWTK